MIEPIIDVIIPIYNGEKFIDSLVETLKGQSFKQFRAVFVNDGSTDNTLKVLTEKLRDIEFPYVIIDKKNAGAAAARNTGIKNSLSKWIVFVDCDDLLSSCHLEYLYRGVSENSTVLGVCGFLNIPLDGKMVMEDVGEFVCSIESAEECMKNCYSNWISPCCLIFDREWFLANDLYFDEQCNYCEDIPFVTGLIEASDNVAKVGNKTYYYIHRVGSAMYSPRIEKYKNGIDAFLRMAERLKKKESHASVAFCEVGLARYMIATLRKGAVQFTYKKFLELTAIVDTVDFKWQIKNLVLKHKLAGYLYLISKRLFYYGIRILFSE